MEEVSYIERFTILIKMLAEQEYKGNDEVDLFEDKINESDLGRASFGVAKDDWDRIECSSNYKGIGIRPPIPYYAEYYDGFSAPYVVCEWYTDFNILESLLKDNFEELYKEYCHVLLEYVK